MFTRVRVLYMINYRVHVYKYTIGASLTDKSVSMLFLWNLSYSETFGIYYSIVSWLEMIRVRRILTGVDRPGAELVSEY